MAILSAFAKLRKASTCLSICPSLRVQQLASHWRALHEIRYLIIYRKSVEKT